ncbi:unnamed protein product [Peronospora belbahrii]|uniref:Uncharacterized protein n=1 Tax=Peronospora belbahrii TaxID=622444 RepID=A0ABN8CLY1_9STRA|nr:unnamed protein product [Peronospora belbahrii]
MPTVKDMKMPIECETGKEEYKGLRFEFKDWDCSSWTSLTRLNDLAEVNGQSLVSFPGRFIVEYFYKSKAPEVKRFMQMRLDRRRTDYLKQAWEMADFASTFEQKARAHVVSGGRKSTYGRISARDATVAAAVLTPGDG